MVQFDEKMNIDRVSLGELCSNRVKLGGNGELSQGDIQSALVLVDVHFVADCISLLTCEVVELRFLAKIPR